MIAYTGIIVYELSVENMSISDYTNLTIAVVGGLTFVATGIYVFLTYQQFKILESSYQLERRPYLVFRNVTLENIVDPTTQKTSIGVGLLFQNSGKLLLNYSISKASVHLDQTSQLSGLSLNHGGYIFPNQETTYRLGAAPIDDSSAKVLTGQIDYEAEYFSSDKGTVFHSKRKLRFELSKESKNFRYWFMEESEA